LDRINSGNLKEGGCIDLMSHTSLINAANKSKPPPTKYNTKRMISMLYLTYKRRLDCPLYWLSHCFTLKQDKSGRDGCLVKVDHCEHYLASCS
jgi:hypothetical protein